MTETTHYIGRTAEGSRVFAHIDLRPLQAGTWQTVEHTPAPADAVEFAASGFIIARHRRNADSAGQVLDALADVTAPAQGWTAADVASLLAIWRRWHLNSMKAGCAHMPADARERWDRRERVECAAGSGYTFGAAWLVEPLPADVAAEVRRLQSLPFGNVPTDY